MRSSQFFGSGNILKQVVDRSGKPPVVGSRLVAQPQTIPAITGTESGAQSVQTAAAAGKLIFAASEAEAQSAQSVSGSGKLIFTGTRSSAQTAQAVAASGNETFIGGESGAQAAQTSAVSGKEIFSGAAAEFKAGQQAAVAAALIFGGTGSSSQSQQSAIAAARETFIAAGTTAQAPQTVSAFDFPPAITGTAEQAQASQLLSSAGSIPVIPLAGGGSYLRASEPKNRSENKKAKPAEPVEPVIIAGEAWGRQEAQRAVAEGEVRPQAIRGAVIEMQRRPVCAGEGRHLDVDLEMFAAIMLAA
jgi:hypothetical protein